MQRYIKYIYHTTKKTSNIKKYINVVRRAHIERSEPHFSDSAKGCTFGRKPAHYSLRRRKVAYPAPRAPRIKRPLPRGRFVFSVRP